MNKPLPIEHNYGIVVLAAGSSTRLGTPKQLVVFQGYTLIRRAVDISLGVTNKLVVVIGAQAEKVHEELQGLPLIIARNKNFEEGIASSIRLGLNTLIENFETVQAVIFIVCDQPHLSSHLLTQLIQSAEQTGNGIVACTYSDTVGIPVLFRENYFNEILTLTGDMGAKKIIYDHMADVVTIDFPAGNIDIDTPEDLNAVMGDNNSAVNNSLF